MFHGEVDKIHLPWTKSPNTIPDHNLPGNNLTWGKTKIPGSHVLVCLWLEWVSWHVCMGQAYEQADWSVGSLWAASSAGELASWWNGRSAGQSAGG